MRSARSSITATRQSRRTQCSSTRRFILPADVETWNMSWWQTRDQLQPCQVLQSKTGLVELKKAKQIYSSCSSMRGFWSSFPIVLGDEANWTAILQTNINKILRVINSQLKLVNLNPWITKVEGKLTWSFPSAVSFGIAPWICQSMPCIPRALMSWFAFRLHCRNALRAEKRKSPSLIRKTPSTCFIAYPITIMLERWLMGMLTSNLFNYNLTFSDLTTLSLSLSPPVTKSW